MIELIQTIYSSNPAAVLTAIVGASSGALGLVKMGVKQYFPGYIRLMKKVTPLLPAVIGIGIGYVFDAAGIQIDEGVKNQVVLGILNSAGTAAYSFGKVNLK